MYQLKEKYVLDFRNVQYYLEFHHVLKKELDLPDYYGCNFDALWDCFREMVGVPLNFEVIGIENLERRFGDTGEKLLETLEELKDYVKDEFPDSVTVKVIPESEL